MNFDHQEDIRQYIEDNIETHLDPLPAPDNIVIGYPDFDKYKTKVNLFLDFDDYIYDPPGLAFSQMTCTLNAYFSFKYNTTSELMELLSRYSEAFLALFNVNRGFSILDDGVVEETQIYNEIEGTPNVKAILIKIRLYKEI
jgi:hypothetical protein